MRPSSLLAATALVALATPALAGSIAPIVNVNTELANDLRGLTFAADGKIYGSGHLGMEETARQTVVARFNADGALDAAFGGDGVVEIDVAPERNEQSLGVAELADGDVLVAVNAADADGGTSVYLLRLDSTGAKRVAPAWGDEEGKVEVVFGWANGANAGFTGNAPPADTSWDLRVDRSGDAERVVVFGLGAAPQGSGRTDNDRYVVRLLAADGSADPSFNGGKPFTYDSGVSFNDNARRGLVEADGSILAAGYTSLGETLGTHIVLIRLNPDGSLDESFGNFVAPAIEGANPVIQPRPGVAVYNPFRVDAGAAEAYGVARLRDGTYVTTGYGGATRNEGTSTLGYQTTLGPDLVTFHVVEGGLDSGWGRNGAQSIQSEGLGQPTNEERARAVVALSDDRTVHAGRFGGNAAVYVFTPDGQLDTSEDGDGIIQLGHPTNNAQFFNAVLSADGTRIAVTTNANAAGARLVVLAVGE